jgi:hypothetical protein
LPGNQLLLCLLQECLQLAHAAIPHLQQLLQRLLEGSITAGYLICLLCLQLLQE